MPRMFHSGPGQCPPCRIKTACMASGHLQWCLSLLEHRVTVISWLAWYVSSHEQYLRLINSSLPVRVVWPDAD